MKRGDTFVNVNEGSNSHLWIVCIEFSDGSIMMFNLTSLENAADATCVVHVGEHPWVIKDSAIEYERAKLLDPRKISVLEAINCMERQGTATEELIRKILEGAMASRETAGTFKAMIEAVLREDEG